MPCPPSPRTRRRCRCRGFTIIELLTVMAVLGILMAILIPVVGGANNSAKRAKTRVQFAQWATAIEGFRQEYGYYPNIPSSLVNGNTLLFREILSGRGAGPGGPTDFDSTEGTSSVQNRKRIAFISFAEGDLTSGGLIQDAFGNTEIAVLVDKNADGLISVGTNGDYLSSAAPSVKGFPHPVPDHPNGIRASVIFYSPGVGQSSSDMVKSWE